MRGYSDNTNLANLPPLSVSQSSLPISKPHRGISVNVHVCVPERSEQPELSMEAGGAYTVTMRSESSQRRTRAPSLQLPFSKRGLVPKSVDKYISVLYCVWASCGGLSIRPGTGDSCATDINLCPHGAPQLPSPCHHRGPGGAGRIFSQSELSSS